MTAKHGLDCDGTAVRALPHIPAMQTCRSTLPARCIMVRRLDTADMQMDQTTTRPTTTAFTRAGRQAWLLLVLTTLFWGGNVVAARWASGEISPALLVGLRWIIVSFFVLAYAGGRIVEILKSQGVDIARRTVAKYREAIGLGSSVQRRRQKALAGGGRG